jgi:hypothetical protein
MPFPSVALRHPQYIISMAFRWRIFYVDIAQQEKHGNGGGASAIGMTQGCWHL